MCTISTKWEFNFLFNLTQFLVTVYWEHHNEWKLPVKHHCVTTILSTSSVFVLGTFRRCTVIVCYIFSSGLSTCRHSLREAYLLLLSIFPWQGCFSFIVKFRFCSGVGNIASCGPFVSSFREVSDWVKDIRFKFNRVRTSSSYLFWQDYSFIVAYAANGVSFVCSCCRPTMQGLDGLISIRQFC